MWDHIVEKLARLKSLDRQCQVFGAELHQYHLKPCVPENILLGFAGWLRVEVPAELLSFYREVGDGVAGPYYGLRTAALVDQYRASEPYKDASTLRAIARNGETDESDYFEVGREQITGLISIIDEGCGHEYCLVTTGPKTGKVVSVSLEGYVHETDLTFSQFYEAWLDRELTKFDEVQGLMNSTSSLQEIETTIREKFNSLDASDIIASIADAEKPIELFGTTHAKIYHGASQTPWYEKVLADWRKANKGSSHS